MQARLVRSKVSVFSFIAMGLALSSVAQAAPVPSSPLPVAANFEVEKFAGGWFEVASKSHLFSSLRTDAIAAFAIADGYDNTLQATFSYSTRLSQQSISGVLSPKDDRYPATLLFTYSLPPVTSTEFHVLAVADDYSWALVGDSARNNAYVYSRTASIDPQILRSLIIRLSTDFDYVAPERSMSCTYHAGKTVPGCAEILDD